MDVCGGGESKTTLNLTMGKSWIVVWEFWDYRHEKLMLVTVSMMGNARKCEYVICAQNDIVVTCHFYMLAFLYFMMKYKCYCLRGLSCWCFLLDDVEFLYLFVITLSIIDRYCISRHRTEVTQQKGRWNPNIWRSPADQFRPGNCYLQYLMQ